LKKILVLGCGQVGGEVLRKLQNMDDVQIYCFARTKKHDYEGVIFLNSYKELLNPDIVIEALPGRNNIDVEFSYSILKKYLENSINSISCNKMMIQRNGKELCNLAKENNAKLMLSSLMATDQIVDENSFDNFGEELYQFRGKYKDETSNSIVNDLNILMSKGST